MNIPAISIISTSVVTSIWNPFSTNILSCIPVHIRSIGMIFQSVFIQSSYTIVVYYYQTFYYARNKQPYIKNITCSLFVHLCIPQLCWGSVNDSNYFRARISSQLITHLFLNHWSRIVIPFHSSVELLHASYQLVSHPSHP